MVKYEIAATTVLIEHPPNKGGIRKIACTQETFSLNGCMVLELPRKNHMKVKSFTWYHLSLSLVSKRNFIDI